MDGRAGGGGCPRSPLPALLAGVKQWNSCRSVLGIGLENGAGANSTHLNPNVSRACYMCLSGDNT